MKINKLNNIKRTNMKSILLFGLALSISVFNVQAQEKEKAVREADSVKVVADSTVVEIDKDGEKKKVKIIFEYGKEEIDKRIKNSEGNDIVSEKTHRAGDDDDADGVFAGFTFSRFDLGLAKMLNDGKLALTPENEFLEYRGWKSVNVGFDVLQMGYKFSDQFRMHIAAGFDWTHFRLEDDIIILEDTKPLSYTDSPISYSKNRFSSSYLRIPLSFELQTKTSKSGDKIKLAVGPVMGVLLQGSQKFKSDEEGKRKVKDGFNFAPVTYGGFARLGVGSFGVYAKYYFNDMFIDSPDQEGLKNLSFGLMFFF